VPERTLSVLDGSTFVIGDPLGDVRGHEGREHGFFSEDTRFVSRWVLQIADTPLELLGLDQRAHFAARFFLTPRVAPDDDAPCSIMRRRVVDNVWMEEVTVINHLHEPSRVRVDVEVDSDFADLFELKDGVVAERDITCHHDDRTLTLAYEHDDFRRSVTITCSRSASVTRRGFTSSPTLAAGEQWSATFTITPHAAQSGTKALPYVPELAATTLQVLAARQATQHNDSRMRSQARSCTSCVWAS
jgi:hypothetical protein